MRRPQLLDFPTCEVCGKFVVKVKRGVCEECDQPIEGKIYALTGGFGDKCIMNGNTWAESEVK